MVKRAHCVSMEDEDHESFDRLRRLLGWGDFQDAVVDAMHLWMKTHKDEATCPVTLTISAPHSPGLNMAEQLKLGMIKKNLDSCLKAQEAIDARNKAMNPYNKQLVADREAEFRKALNEVYDFQRRHGVIHDTELEEMLARAEKYVIQPESIVTKVPRCCFCHKPIILGGTMADEFTNYEPAHEKCYRDKISPSLAIETLEDGSKSPEGEE
jgi:hypothetical protein